VVLYDGSRGFAQNPSCQHSGVCARDFEIANQSIDSVVLLSAAVSLDSDYKASFPSKYKARKIRDPLGWRLQPEISHRLNRVASIDTVGHTISPDLKVHE
jgi:hypothetical protein